MNDNPITTENDSEGNASSSSSLIRGMNYESHSFSPGSRDFKLEIIPLIDDSEMEGTCEDSLSYIALLGILRRLNFKKSLIW